MTFYSPLKSLRIILFSQLDVQRSEMETCGFSMSVIRTVYKSFVISQM